MRLVGAGERDLVLTRLVGDARPLTEDADADPDPDQFIARVIEAGATDIGRLAAKSPGVIARLRSAYEEYGPLFTDGLGMRIIEALHSHPDRVIHTPSRVVLLRAVASDDRLIVAGADWTVDRRPDRSIEEVRGVELNEFVLPDQAVQVTGLLRQLAHETSFVPFKGLRCLLLLSPRASATFADAAAVLGASAAVAGGELRSLAVGNPSDVIYLKAVRKALGGNWHQLFVSLSLPTEGWVSRLGNDYGGVASRTWLRLPYDDIGLASDKLAISIEAIIRAEPDYPLLEWGDDAFARVGAFVGAAFRLTNRASAHLRRNRYPDVERMLDHLQRLAELAQLWHDSEGVTEDRFEDWARSKSELVIALSDKGIPLKDAYFMFEDQRLNNRPHVKVDDNVPASRCGRIYFALDSRNRRVVVDHVGLHDRY